MTKQGVSMRKIRLIFAILCSATIFLYAEGGCAGTGQISGIPTKSCYERLSSFYMGIQTADGTFFIDCSKDIQYKSKT